MDDDLFDEFGNYLGGQQSSPSDSESEENPHIPMESEDIVIDVIII